MESTKMTPVTGRDPRNKHISRCEPSAVIIQQGEFKTEVRIVVGSIADRGKILGTM